MACNLDSRLGQLEEQGKTMVDATRRLREFTQYFFKKIRNVTLK